MAAGAEVALGFGLPDVSDRPVGASDFGATTDIGGVSTDGSSACAGIGLGATSFVCAGDVAAQASDIRMSDAATMVLAELSLIC